ncbi:hypothetical protein BJ138DRAFT_116023 [Hygrophoropsis aurantiaca]|uniref:Uncharacterized protein n=1 Tax=Hygrophoropsis aurantiaca TaxID=72124 RepID=A0ACB7ZR72_9AGAM|nr:hypothetical protein BJ138DRAFT_116023 [Hygrophoropsis aurantiaca]
MKAIRSSSAAVITRSPKTIACLNLVSSTDSVFVIFDSHPRPGHPGGAGLISTLPQTVEQVFHNALAPKHPRFSRLHGNLSSSPLDGSVPYQRTNYLFYC